MILAILCFSAIAIAEEEIPVSRIGDGPPAPNEYIFWLNQNTPLTQFTSSGDFQKLVDIFHVSVMTEYNIGSLSGALIKGDDGILEALSENSLVQNIAPNFRLYGAATFDDEECIEEQDPLGNQKWDLTRISSRDRPDYNGGTYHYTGYEQGQGVDVYIADSGIRTTHQSFGGRASHGFTARGLQEDEGDNDDHGHGTHVAGLVAGDIFGTAKQANVIAVKVLNSENWGYYSWWTEGMRYVVDDYKAKKETQGCRAKCIVNMSLGGTYGSDTFEPVIREAVNEGCVFVVAAMNEASNACPYTPAFMPEVITVGATTSNDVMASWSNFGTCVDILAPGSSIVSAGHNSDSATRTMSGTSMATPLTAGVIARYAGARVGMPSNDNVRDFLYSTATEGAISDAESKNTPNLLAYAACEMVEKPCDDDDDECECEDDIRRMIPRFHR